MSGPHSWCIKSTKPAFCICIWTNLMPNHHSWCIKSSRPNFICASCQFCLLRVSRRFLGRSQGRVWEIWPMDPGCPTYWTFGYALFRKRDLLQFPFHFLNGFAYSFQVHQLFVFVFVFAAFQVHLLSRQCYFASLCPNCLSARLSGQMWIFSKCDTMFAGSCIWRCQVAPRSRTHSPQNSISALHLEQEKSGARHQMALISVSLLFQRIVVSSIHSACRMHVCRRREI